ncbi:MAG TPA: hypothetical protein VI078_04775, partial [bacterium]
MKRALVAILALAVFAALAVPAAGVIYEVADSDGNVTHYKYTDRKGSVVFTDNLASIPENVRTREKVVRVGPPPKPKEPAGAQAPAAEAAAPAPPPESSQALQDALKTTFPVVPPPPPEESGGFAWWMAALIVAVAAVGGGFALKAVRSRQPAPAPRSAPTTYRLQGADDRRGTEKPEPLTGRAIRRVGPARCRRRS